MPGNEKSIIQIIQKMVQDNESEDKIISTLQSMGITSDQAKRLVLIAQADTFTLLKSEIDKIVQEKVAVQKEALQKDSSKFIDNMLEMKKKDMKIEMEKEFIKYKTDFIENQKKFQTGVNDSISKIAKLNEQSYALSEENKKTIDVVNKDLSETKLKGIKLRRSFSRSLLLLFGILSFIAGIVTITTVLLSDFNVDYVTAAIIFALIGTALTYLSANI